MPTFHIEANGETYEIDAPDENAAMKAWQGLGGSGGAGGAPASAPSAASPPVAPSPAPPPAEGWSAGRVLRDLGHYPSMLAETAANAAIGTANLPVTLFNTGAWAGNKVGNALFNDSLEPSQIPLLPSVDFGANAKPAGRGEALSMGAFGGATSALMGSGISRAGSMLQASGKDIAAEIPKLLREAGVLGGVPGVVTAGADQTGAFDGLDPHVRTIAEGLVGAGAAIASHHYLGGNPVEAVAAKLGTSKDSNEAGVEAKAAAQEWRTALPAKLEALKGIVSNSTPPGESSRPYPVGPSGHFGDFDTGPGTGPPDEPMLFGKVPLHSAEIDNSEIMRVTHALATEDGVYEDFYPNFVSKLPQEVQDLFDSIALSNKPITLRPPLRPGQAPIQTYREGEVPGEMNTYGPVMDGTATHEPQGPGMRGAWEVPRAAGASGEAPFAPGASGAQGPQPFLHPNPEPDTGYRPNWQFGLNNPPEASPPPPSPGEAPKAYKRNARGQFVSKGYGIAETPPEGPALQAERGGTWGEPNGGAGSAAPVPTPNPLAPYTPPPPNSPTGPVQQPGETTIGFRAPLTDAMKLRSTIGEWISDPPRLMPKGIDEAHAKAYYAALSADIGQTMEHYGARAEWNTYNDNATSLYRTGDLLSKFADSTNEAKDSTLAGKAVQGIWSTMGKDSSEVETLRREAPKAADELAAAFIRTSPEKWNRLPSATQAALVPNPFDRLALTMHTAAKSSLADEVGKTRQAFEGGGLGYLLGDLMMPHGQAEGSTSLMSPDKWAMLGAAMPSLLQFAGHIKSNPKMLNVPLIGGVAGSVAGQQQSDGESPLLQTK